MGNSYEVIGVVWLEILMEVIAKEVSFLNPWYFSIQYPSGKIV